MLSFLSVVRVLCAAMPPWTLVAGGLILCNLCDAWLQAEADHQAELERQEQAREAELQRRAERQDGASKRRQLREVVGWLKAAAKSPEDAAFNR